MAKKKTTTKKTKAKGKSLVVRKKSQKKELIWAGAKRVMGKAEGPKDIRERKIILLTSRVLDVSPFGVNILGSVPYINKLGLEQKAKRYSPKVKFVYNWVQRSRNDEDKAICECKLQVGGRDLCDWVTGECSPSSMKMGTLKGYQNHMAQTRARNRAILETFGTRIHEEMMANIEKLSKKQDVSDREVIEIGNATKTSVEEISNNPPFSVSKVHKKNGKEPETLFDVLSNRIENEEDDETTYKLMLKIRGRKVDKLLSQSAKDKLLDQISKKLGVKRNEL